MQLIVLGMHRSGTSSVTRLLNLAGAYFGPEGIATDANEENPKGFWERRDVRDVCDGLLHDGGFDWWKVAGFDVERIPEAQREIGVEAFRRIVLQLDAHRPWVVKEPRLSLLLPVLRPTLEAPVFIHVAREPLEIAQSLHARNDFPAPASIALWEAYTLHAWAATGGEPRVLVSYGELMRDPVAATATLIEQLTDLGVQGLRLPTEREITAFVTPSLHRQHESSDARRGQLNAEQAALADQLDDGRLLEADTVPALSTGASAALEAFEESQARAADIERLRIEAEAVETAHREAVALLELGHRDAIEALETAHGAEVERLAAGLRLSEAAREEAAQADLAARATATRAAESLGLATQRIQSLKRSGAVRMGSRLSVLRERLLGRRTGGVDVAIQSALVHVERARTTLEPQVDEAQSPPITPAADDPPPPVEELQARRRAALARGDRPKVAVVTWDVGHNPFGRAHLLADLLQDRCDVELWGAQFDRYGSTIWPPLRDTAIPVMRYSGSSFPDFLGTMENMARRIDADAIYVSKPRFPSLGLGVLAKEWWNRPLVVDVDDFELSFFDELDALPVTELMGRRRDPDALLPFGRLWTRACESVVRAADQVTVSNPELHARYGGVIVPHARDESRFDPARFDRAAARRRLGLGHDDRLILFGGTPRAHKGILELLEAVDTLGDDHVRVGAFGTYELDGLRKQIGSLARWILPLPHAGFDELPGVLAATDLACALQSPTHPVSRYQMPAKVTDAMAMGVPCLVTAVPPLQPLIDKDVVEVHDGDTPLHERIREIFANVDETADRAQRARLAFLDTYSYAAVRPVVHAAIDHLLEDPPPLAPELSSLVTASRDLFPTASTLPRPPRPRPRIEAGATFDLAVFWKQNDTGIYGRRQDMFLRYLERSGRFHTIVHFDHPMSAEGLALVARRSIGTTDQNRLVLAQTLRRIAHRSDRGSLRQRTFVYTAGRRTRRLRLPRRQQYVDYVRTVLERERSGQRPLMVWVYPTSPFLPDVIDALAPDVVVADVVDDNRTWYERGTAEFDNLEQNYIQILARSDVVLANCEPVAESMRAFTPRVEVVPNACELPDGTPSPGRPRELADVRGPLIGYAGNLSDRIDLPLLRELVQARRDWTFVFLGSTHLDATVLDLASEPNVRFLGTKRYDEAQAIIRHFDVGLIPHLDNAMTRSMNPLKAYVYCSLGVPIVSTPVANIDDVAGPITIASGPEEFVAAIEGALAADRPMPDRATLLPHSWDERVERVLGLVDAVVQDRS